MWNVSDCVENTFSSYGHLALYLILFLQMYAGFKILLVDQITHEAQTLLKKCAVVISKRKFYLPYRSMYFIEMSHQAVWEGEKLYFTNKEAQGAYCGIILPCNIHFKHLGTPEKNCKSQEPITRSVQLPYAKANCFWEFTSSSVFARLSWLEKISVYQIVSKFLKFCRITY